MKIESKCLLNSPENTCKFDNFNSGLAVSDHSLLQLPAGHPRFLSGVRGSGQILQSVPARNCMGIQSRVARTLHYRLRSSVRHSHHHSYYRALRRKLLL